MSKAIFVDMKAARALEHHERLIGVLNQLK
jgi:hypothetical protein